MILEKINLKYCVELFKKYKVIIMYLIFGVFTTLVNILVYTILSNFLTINYLISNMVAWIASVIFAFVTNKIYVFESSEKCIMTVFKEVLSFFAARLASLGFDMIFMYLGCSILSFNDIIVKILSNIIVIIINYFFSKYVIFKSK